MIQGRDNSANNNKEIYSIFKNKPKPISYVKGDIAYIAEISEESLIRTNRWGNSGIENSDNKNNEISVSKKGLSDDKIHIDRKIKIGIYFNILNVMKLEMNNDYWNEESNTKINFNGVSSHVYKENYQINKLDKENDNNCAKEATKSIIIEESYEIKNSKRGT